MLSTIQVDLDSLWTYQRYLNKQIPDSRADPVYTQSLPRFLDLFAKYKLKATFFIVGQDALNPSHEKPIKAIIARGHEIANHSMTHPLNFTALGLETIKREITEAHKQLESAIGQRPMGFRAPGFSVDERVMAVLEDLGYKYDASLVPSAVFPGLMNAAHSILKLRLINTRSGSTRFAKAAKSAYHPDHQDIASPGTMKIKEVPLSVSAWGFPLHSTYVFALGRFLFDSGLDLCIKKNTSMQYLFHGIDLLDIEQYGIRLPGFKSLTKRQNICEYIIKRLKDNSRVMTTADLAANGKENNDLYTSAGF